MEKSILKYIEALMGNSPKTTNKKDVNSDLVKDCFNIIAPYIADKDCCIMLVNQNHQVIGLHGLEGKRDAESIIGRTLKFPLNCSPQAGKMFWVRGEASDHGEVFLYLCSPPSGDKDLSKYLICAVTTRRDAGVYEELLNNLWDGMRKSIDIHKKHLSDSRFILNSLDFVEEGISIADKDGRLVYVNKACCEIVGMDREELLFKNIEDITRSKPLLSEVLESQKSVIDVEYFLKLKDKTVHLINSGYPVSDEKGNTIGAIDIFRGIKRSTKLVNTIAGYKASYCFEDIIGESKVIKEKINLAKMFARSDANVLIQGESGTGKELFAESIHNYSNRRSEPFIAINCANFPNDLMDSELFGYEEGAFTGAQKGGRQGKFEIANGGTLFLDEIGEMQLHLQAKLLRVVETKTINRIGGNRPINVDVRIIAATNRDLEAMVNAGKFRKDLYYRLKVLFVDIPPLRERREDILLLAEHFLEKLGNRMQKKVRGIDHEAKKMLMSHDWPGNLRELENTISRALFVCDGDYIRKEHLLMEEPDGEECEALGKGRLDEMKKKMVLEALKITKGNKKRAAELLGISRPTLYRILKNM